MAFCKNCGVKIEDEVKFCPGCGTQVAGEASYKQQENTQKAQSVIDDITNTADSTDGFDPSDIEQNKMLSLFSYIGILFLIPLLAAPQSRFARFHANQGIVLFLCEMVYSIVYGILSTILWFIPVIGPILIAIFGIIYVVFFALMIIGIINAVNGKAKDLPIIGGIRILK